MTQPETTTFACAYFGPGDECVGPGCGGWVPEYRRGPGMPFCSDECAAAHQDEVYKGDAAVIERHRREEAFAACSEVLVGMGYAPAEVDRMLVGIPT